MKRSILIVEDQSDVREALKLLIEHLLKQAGIEHDITLCGDCDEGLRAIAAHEPFDAIVTDLDCPRRYGGAEITAGARRRSDRTQVIVVTGRLEADPDEIRNKCQAHEYLQKPPSLEQLGAALGRCVGHFAETV